MSWIVWVLLLIVFGLIGLLLWYVFNREGFSLSNKPLEQDNSHVMQNPYDNVDYRTPVFLPIR